MAKDTKATKAFNPKHNIKFPIHDTHLNKLFSNLKVAVILSLIAPMCVYVMHNVPRDLAYKNFYSNYDPLDAFDRMRSGGYLSSCPAKEDKGKKDKDKNKK